VTSLLATNDFPPKVGGIQSYLYDLWCRLPAAETAVLTTPYPGDAEWDARQPFRIERTKQGFLLPTARLRRAVDSMAREIAANVVFIDPMLPLGLVGPRLTAAPYVVVTHGAEVTVYGRTPGSAALARRVLRGATGVVACGEFAARVTSKVARRALPTILVPPGVDTKRYRPLDVVARRAARARLGLPVEAPLVVGVSRLVPRKGFDILLRAVADLPGVHVAIAGSGRDRARLEGLARRFSDRVHFLGRVSDDDLPSLYGCADVFAMLCRDRWGGLEAEGFGIVFLEAAAAGVPAIAGRSGGSAEAVVDGATGYVVEPRDVRAVRARLVQLLDDDALRHRLGAAGRQRVEHELSLDVLAARLAPVAAGDFGALAPYEA
jgi:phosphatidylinositol alpha-1,6-mannosyltransferase